MPKRTAREAKIWPLLEWRAIYSSGFPVDPAERPLWLSNRLTVEGLPDASKNWEEPLRMYRKLRADERHRLCAKFFRERAHMGVYTVLYRHGGRLVAVRQEAPDAEGAAYDVSAAVGHKCLIIAVMAGCVEFARDGRVPQVFCFWDNDKLVINVSAWRALKRTREIKIGMA